MTLAHGLSEREAADLSATLNRRGVAVTRSTDGASDRYAIEVAQSAVPLAWDTVHAQCSAQQSPPAAASALLSTREAELRAQEQRLEAKLSSAIKALPRVHSAAVMITLARTDNKLTDLVRPATSSAARAVASLVCAARGGCPNTQQVSALLSAALPGLSSNNIRILQQTEAQPEPACAELGHVGPLTVTRASLPTLKLWFAASLVVHMLGSLALLLLVQRRRRPSP